MGGRRVVVLSAAVLLSTLKSIVIGAQELKGTVSLPDGSTPARGVIVVLLDGTRDTIVARVVTGERGLFAVRAPKPMTVRLQLLRLGSRPTVVGTYELGAGASREVNVTLQENPIALARFDVKSSGNCAVHPDTGLLVAQLYEEARKALLSSTSLISGVTTVAAFTRYTRNENLKGQLTAPVQRTTITGPTARPFVSLSADSLARVGYVTEEQDGTVYRAPDAEVLFSDVFLREHCLQLVPADGKHRRSVGIGFRAPKRGKGVVELRGTMWLDDETAELQSVDFEYDGVAREYTKNRVGGVVEFTHMENGLWFVNSWAIRMPQTSLQRATGFSANLSTANNTGTEVVFDGLQTVGGSVQSVKLNGELLYASSDLSFLAGDMLKPTVTSGRDVQPAAGVPPAAGALTIDSLTAVSSCGASVDAQHIGSAVGRITDEAHRGLPGAVVLAEWKEDFKLRSSTEFQWQYRRLTTTAAADGSYTVCGLPLLRPVTLSATTGVRASRMGTVRVEQRHPSTPLDLTIRTPPSAAIVARGATVIVTDMNGRPIAHALVMLDANQRVTDDDGVLTLKSAPGDSLKVLVRRIGYTAFDGIATRGSRNDAFVVKLIPAAQTLKTVNVVATRSLAGLETTGFYQRVFDIQRGAVDGEFYTPEQLEQRGATKFSDIFSTSRFVRATAERGHGDPGAGVSEYAGLGVGVYLLGRGGCTMAVFVDGVRMQAQPKIGGDRESAKVSIDELVEPSAVRGIEIYPSGASAPAGLAPAFGGSNCGIIAVWTAASR